MPNPSDDIDMQVLSDLNGRTLVDGAAVDRGLISSALNISAEELRDVLNRLQQQGYVSLSASGEVGLTPAGHEHLAVD